MRGQLSKIEALVGHSAPFLWHGEWQTLGWAHPDPLKDAGDAFAEAALAAGAVPEQRTEDDITAWGWKLPDGTWCSGHYARRVAPKEL